MASHKVVYLFLGDGVQVLELVQSTELLDIQAIGRDGICKKPKELRLDFCRGRDHMKTKIHEYRHCLASTISSLHIPDIFMVPPNSAIFCPKIVQTEKKKTGWVDESYLAFA